jgi:hypothetical protein
LKKKERRRRETGLGEDWEKREGEERMRRRREK